MAFLQEIPLHDLQAIEQPGPDFLHDDFSQSQLFGLQEHFTAFRSCNGAGDEPVIVGSWNQNCFVAPKSPLKRFETASFTPI